MGGKKVFELMIEIGDKSTPLSKRMPNGYTHKWTAFIRGVNNSKIEHCIQRVVFQLHESFQTPERVLVEPPFQVRETGYAGFEIPIEVYFKNRDKTNHVMFLHDLVLLNDKPNGATRIEKIKFINPTKEFEKCLVKSGAQLLPSSGKKERSGSPPAKKQKSSSLIPSKDMSKQFQTTTTSTTTTTTTAAVASTTNATTLSNNQAPIAKASKNSREFIDMFGAPLVFGGQTAQTAQPVSQPIITPVQHSVQITSNSSQSKHHHNHSHNSNSNHNHNHNHNNNSHQQTPKEESVKNHHHNHHLHQHHNHQSSKQEEQPVDELQVMQTKISALTDGNRLQKIVDIIEEAGEWFNLTSGKFEFDLKRLDKKTLSKIERYLH